MCGRYTRYLSWSEIHRLYRLTTDWERQRNDAPAYNIAPTEDVVFVTAGENGNHKLREGRWWLVPWWAKEMPKGAMFNARSETADTSGAFKDAFKSKRCLIPADGFYEWTQSPADKGRDPWYIFLPDHRPFSFAGLWAHNDNLGITSCTILTAPAQDPMVSLHDRQPVILAPEVYDAWLDPRTPGGEAKALLSQDLDGQLQFYRVDRQVNSSKNKGGDEMIAPIDMRTAYGI
ncbi:SOS response-associated peptidase [Mesorhizobium sp. CC13]|uniref:SOS response-associated peptidase n=1 Tax=unclassified Mesorhizobium TaxID=325217 RepID=UPI000FE4CECE|nr:SOS response-associated peptidase [Mesorhizobium sp.]RWK68299.1 MAG: SOS response-associated peptidase [Mesorhizobium sp.]